MCSDLLMARISKVTSTIDHILTFQKGKVTNKRSESGPVIDGEEGTEDHTNSDRTSQIMTNASGFMLMDKPSEPKPVDISRIKAEVLDKMSQCLRPPGEPKLKISLKENNKTDDDPKDGRCAKF